MSAQQLRLFMYSRVLLWGRSLDKYSPCPKAHLRIFSKEPALFRETDARFWGLPITQKP